MNKIIDTQCECCNTDTILKIVAGNDFTLRLALTYHEDDVVKEYDLSDIQDLKVIAYSPEGVDREVDSMVDIATNRIIAVIDSYEYINYVPYGIDITWYDEPNHKRASAPNLFAFVNSSSEANDSQDVIVSGPYDYNLEIKSDIAYVSVGEIPEVDLTDYVTNSELNTTLQNYETKKELETTLDYYATKKYVDDAMLDIDLTDYYTKSEVDTTLQNYGTSLSSGIKMIGGPSIGMDISLNSNTQTLSTLTIPSFQKNINSSVPKGWVISPVTSIGFVSRSTVETIYDTVDNVNAIMSDYITSTSLNTTLQNYETKKELETTLDYYATKKYVDNAILAIDLSDYVTSTSLNTTLQDYVTNSALSTSLNPITNDITSLDTRVTTLENNPSGVSQEDWDNSNEAIAKELTNNRLEHLSINDKFSYYYTKTEADNRYATASWANNKFVTKTDDVNRQEAIAAAFAYLQTSIDEKGGGQEIDLSSYVTIDEMNNYSEVVSTALTYHKLDIINTNDKFNDYYTMTQSDNRYITSNDVAQKYVSNSSLDNLSHVVASSLNDLNDRMPSNTSDLTNDSGFVVSTSVHNIWTGSQSDYDQLTPEADTLYIII